MSRTDLERFGAESDSDTFAHLAAPGKNILALSRQTDDALCRVRKADGKRQ